MFNAKRLLRAVDIDITRRLEVNKTVMRAVGSNDPVPVDVFVGYIEPRQLKKLKYKAIFSIRGDMIKEGDSKEAEEIIRHERT